MKAYNEYVIVYIVEKYELDLSIINYIISYSPFNYIQFKRLDFIFIFKISCAWSLKFHTH